MLKQILFITLIFLMLTGCSEKPTQPEESDLPTARKPTDELNYFNFELKADSLTKRFEYPLNFSTDSLAAKLVISEYVAGRGYISILSTDSLVIYWNYLDINRNYPSVNLIGNLPLKITIDLQNYSGNINFTLKKQPPVIDYDTTGTTRHKDAIYFNSFEEPSDTSHLSGRSYHIAYDVPLGGGARSLLVAGGCIVPHVFYDLDPLQEDGKFILQCWGKALEIGGTVTLRNEKMFRTEGISLGIMNEEWTFLISSDTLFCQKDGILSLEMFSGGIIPRSMLVDLVQIIRVD